MLALIRMLPMLTRSGFPSMSHRFPLAPFVISASSPFGLPLHVR